MKTRKQLVTIEDAKPCDSQPSKPCSDCPWARTALVGWLGGATIDEWLATAHSDSKINCHTLIGPQCAGAAIYRSNILKRPRDKTILLLPKNTVDVFANPFEFIKHHTHKPKKNMLYNLIKKYKGDETVVMTDTYTKVNARKKTLVASQRKGVKQQRVEYSVKKTEETEKFQKPPHTPYGKK